MVYKRNYLWLFGVLLSTLFMTSCSDEHEALQSTDQTSTVVQASVSAFKVDGKISSVAGENEINDIWGIERSGFFNGREKWAKDFENQRV